MIRATPASFFNKKNSYLTIIILVLVVFSILVLDQPISLFFQKPELASIQNFSRKITDIGLGEYWFGLAFSSLFIAFLLKLVALKRVFQNISSLTLDRVSNIQFKIREFGITLLVSLIASGLVVHIFKWSLGRQRPHKSEIADPHVFLGFTNQWHFHSLPSGHSQVLYTVATCIALFQPKEDRRFKARIAPT